MQKDELVVTRIDQAEALQDAGFLGQFVTPASPSDVAKNLGIAANLAHHHAQKHVNLGLLTETRRVNGKVYYQLAAKTFKHESDLLLSPDTEKAYGLHLSLLKKQFLNAYGRSDSLATADPGWCVYQFSTDQNPALPAPFTPFKSELLEAHPAHFQVRTVRLSQARYLAVVEQIREILETTEAESGSGKDTCTLAFLAFDGELRKGVQDGHEVSSFVPPN